MKLTSALRVFRFTGWTTVGTLVVGFFLAAPAFGQELILDFEDGLMPSAHGWKFSSCSPCGPGEDQPYPLTESQVARVADGVLYLDTTRFGGVWAGDTSAWWQFPLEEPSPADYEYEIRMRAIAPDSYRSCGGGLMGAGMGVIAAFESGVNIMVPQLSFYPCFLMNLDCAPFRTYRVVVRNGSEYQPFVDDVEVAGGSLPATNYWKKIVHFGDGSTSGGNVTVEIDYLRFRPLGQEITEVTIDIKPGGYPNSINLKSKGTVPVAVFGSSTFDIRKVLPATVTLAGAPIRLKNDGSPMASFEDINLDGYLDLIVHVRNDGLQLGEADTEAALEGQTTGEIPFRGTDSVRIVR